MRLAHASLLAVLLMPAAYAQEKAPPAKQDFAALKADYDAAMKDFSAKIRAASADDRAAMMKEAPAAKFLDQFKAGATDNAGKPEAVPYLVWLLQNDRTAAREHMTTLMEKHLEHPGLGAAVPQLGRMQKDLGKENVMRWLGKLADQKNDPETAAKALMTRAQMFTGTTAGPSTAQERAGAVADLEHAVDLTKEERTKKECADLITGEQTFGIDKAAPEIAADDVDGVPFKLSDYRGKVVLLDFWGFW